MKRLASGTGKSASELISKRIRELGDWRGETLARNARPGIRTLTQSGRGKGDALRTGFADATGNIIVTLDADGSADPAEVPWFVEDLLAGADFAKGSRFLDEGGSTDITRTRRVGNWTLCTIVNLLYGTHYSDLCYGYNAFWATVSRISRSTHRASKSRPR